jgi:dTDP-4-dehydrorhamnose 3,5-epimerase
LTIEIEELPLAGLKLLRPRMYRDDRGYFLEMYNEQRLKQAGIGPFVQDNLSLSTKNVLRGLHLQCPEWQAKLVSVVRGRIYDVVVDIRKDSPTFGRWHGVPLSEEQHEQLYVPQGFAHGFCVLSETASVHYKCSTFYRPEQEQTLLYNDPALGIEWPVKNPILSPKDARGVPLSDLRLP